MSDNSIKLRPEVWGTEHIERYLMEEEIMIQSFMKSRGKP